jgi:peptidylprolyl isomerase
MKTCAALLLVAVAAGLSGCGGEAETTASAGDGSGDPTVARATPPKEDYPLPKLPPQRGPLEKLVVRDLEVGKGPVARWGDEVTVRYVGVYWKTGEIFSQNWHEPLDFELDGEWFGVGWQRGVHGMRVGGRRELRVPGALLAGKTDVAYVVFLSAVKARPQ